MHCHIAFILIPLNSLSPVSDSIFCMAAVTLLSVSLRCSSRLPFELYILPRYLYLGTSSRVVLFRVILLFCPGPIFTILHFAAPNSMWYFFATWFVMSSICCSVVRSWCMRQTSSIHRRVLSVVPCLVFSPMLFFLSSLAISSISVAYSITDRTPPCLMLSLILISLVSPCLVWILALRFVFIFLIIIRFFPDTPFWFRA